MLNEVYVKYLLQCLALIHSFLHSVKYIMCLLFVPGTILSASDSSLIKTSKILVAAYSYSDERRIEYNKCINYIKCCYMLGDYKFYRKLK